LCGFYYLKNQRKYFDAQPGDTPPDELCRAENPPLTYGQSSTTVNFTYLHISISLTGNSRSLVYFCFYGNGLEISTGPFHRTIFNKETFFNGLLSSKLRLYAENEPKRRKWSQSKYAYYNNSTATFGVLLKCGDVERNPGPANTNKNKSSPADNNSENSSKAKNHKGCPKCQICEKPCKSNQYKYLCYICYTDICRAIGYAFSPFRFGVGYHFLTFCLGYGMVFVLYIVTISSFLVWDSVGFGSCRSGMSCAFFRYRNVNSMEKLANVN